jgi:hypothetical protein
MRDILINDQMHNLSNEMVAIPLPPGPIPAEPGQLSHLPPASTFAG